MAHGKHLRQFWCRDSLHERRRYRIEHTGRAVACNNPFGMGNERIRITEQTTQSLQYDQVRASDVALLGNPAKGHLDDIHYGTHMGIDECQTGQFLLERP